MKERQRARLREDRGEQENMSYQNSKRERVRQTEIKRSDRERGRSSEVARREILSKIEEEREKPCRCWIRHRCGEMSLTWATRTANVTLDATVGLLVGADRLVREGDLVLRIVGL